MDKRLLTETLHQLEAVNLPERLASVLSSPPVFTTLYGSHEADLLRLWKEIQNAVAPPEHFLDPALALLRSKRSSLLSSTLWEQCNFYQMRGNWDKTIELARELVLLSEALGDEERNMNSTRALGLWQLQRGEFEEAEQLLTHSREIARRRGDRMGEGGATCNIGLIRFLRGDTLTASGYFAEALEHFRAIKYRRWESFALGNLGFCYVALRRYSEALANFEQVLSLSVASNDRPNIVRTTGAIGYAYLGLTNYDEARRHSLDSIALAEELHMEYDIGCACDCMAISYLEQGKLEEARTFIDRGEDIFKRLRNKRDLSSIDSCRAQLEWDSGRFAEGLILGLQALSSARELAAADLVAKNQRWLSSALICLLNDSRATDVWNRARSAHPEISPNWKEATNAYVHEAQATFQAAGDTPMVEELSRLTILLRYDPQHREDALASLRMLLDRQQDDSQRAHTFYWIWRLSQEDMDRERARMSLQTQYEKTLQYVFKKLLEELDSADR